MVLLLYALTAFLPEAWPKTIEFTILYFLLPAVYLLTLVTREGAGFSGRFYRLLSSCVSALALASIVFILLMLVNLTLEILFSLTHISNRLIEVSRCFCYIFLTPMLFISFESQEGKPEVALLAWCWLSAARCRHGKSPCVPRPPSYARMPRHWAS